MEDKRHTWPISLQNQTITIHKCISKLRKNFKKPLKSWQGTLEKL